LGHRGYREAHRGRRSILKAGAFLAMAVISASGAFAADQGCKTSHALTGRCYVVRGKISLATEIGATLEISGVKKTLVIRAAPDGDRLKILPDNVLALIRKEPRPAEVSGTYQVCPVPAESPLVKAEHVCVESGSNLSGIRPPRPVQP
jgi:hypothetical protein